eukprot:m.155884 g.155884  ORF g.155884 m.155884 type:complete len:5601 (-) comp20817_c4_seq1:60-16862(-)
MQPLVPALLALALGLSGVLAAQAAGSGSPMGSLTLSVENSDSFYATSPSPIPVDENLIEDDPDVDCLFCQSLTQALAKSASQVALADQAKQLCISEFDSDASCLLFAQKHQDSLASGSCKKVCASESRARRWGPCSTDNDCQSDFYCSSNGCFPCTYCTYYTLYPSLLEYYKPYAGTTCSACGGSINAVSPRYSAAGWIGESVTLTYQATNMGSTLSLKLYSRDATNAIYDFGTVSNTGSTTVTYPTSLSTGDVYFVLASVTDPSNNGRLPISGYFISLRARVTVTSPTSATQVTAGRDSVTVSWTTVGGVGAGLAFHLMRTGSTSIHVERILSSTQSSGSLEWSVPYNLATGNYFIAVTPVDVLVLLGWGPAGTYPNVAFAVTAPPTCSAHSQCLEAEYCAIVSSSVSRCYPCSVCQTLRNAFDQVCPDNCLHSPLQLGESVPDMSAVAAVGPVQDVLPGCDNLETLAYNNNSAIVFANDTAGSLKHRMSQRLSDKLDALQLLVEQVFGAGVHVLVLEAYLAPPEDPANATLQNEGRAVHISLTPMPAGDPLEHLGLLAGLAVRARVDWVGFLVPEFVTLAVINNGCRVPLDLIFLLDGSGSVEMPQYGGTPGNFGQKMLPFVQDVVEFFEIGYNKTRVGVATFSTSTTINFDLNSYFNKTAMLNAIANIPYPEGGTYTRLALETVRTEMFTAASGARPESMGVSRVLVVITDGQANYGYEPNAAPYFAADALHTANINVFSMGIGTGADLTELQQIASLPYNTHVFQLEGFSELNELVNTMSASTCSEPTAVSTGSETNSEVELCGMRFFRPTCGQRANLTIVLTTTFGRTTIYVSLNNTHPSAASNDFTGDGSNSSQVTINTGSSSAYIAVQGFDVNNAFTLSVWSDIFEGLDNSTSYLREDAPVGSTVFEPPAVESEYYTPNLQYWILSGNELGLFAIDNNTGLVTLAAPIDYEMYQSFTLRIGARDLSLTCLSGFTTVFVNVVDINDNAPQFTSSLSAAVMEDAAVGTLVTTLTALDSDSGLNGHITFSLSSPGCANPTAQSADAVYITGTFPYYGPTNTRANCLWFATGFNAASSYSCTWHGCYGQAQVLSNSVVKCIRPNAVLDPRLAAFPLRIAVRVFHKDDANPSNNNCFSTAGLHPGDFVQGNYATFNQGQSCLPGAPPTASTAFNAALATCSASTRPVCQSAVCYQDSGAATTTCSPPTVPFAVAADGNVTTTGALNYEDNASFELRVLATDHGVPSLTTAGTLTITVYPAPCAAGTYSSTGTFPCQACAPGTYSAAGSTSCAPCGCPANQYASGTCTATHNFGCTACPPFATSPAGSTGLASCSCTGSRFLNLATATCDSCQNCAANQYQTAACSATAQTQCANCKTSCVGDAYLDGVCGGTSDYVCRNCSTCGANQYMVSDCTLHDDRQCSGCTNTCPNANEYLQGSCSGTTTPVCTPCTTSCSPTQYLVGTCSLHSNPQCQDCLTSCAANQYLSGTCDGVNGPRCLPCHIDCASCNGPSQTQCTACPASKVMWQGRCLSACPPTFFENANRVCDACPSHCATCSDASTCTGCSAGYFLHAGQCVDTCPPTTFRNTATGTCQTCQTCAAGFYIFAACTGNTNTDCVQWRTCGANEFEIVAPNITHNRQCQTCRTSCGAGQQISPTCGPTSDNTCVDCPAGQYKSTAGAGTCQPCVTTCSAGFYLSSTACTSVSSPTCLPCRDASECLPGQYLQGTCTVQSNPTCTACTACDPGEYQTQACGGTQNRACATCLTQCPTGQYLTGTCGGALSTSCASCLTQANCAAQGAFYVAGTCSGRNFTTCAACHSTCQSCTGPAATQCTSCPASSFLHGGSCVTQCPAGTWADPTTGQCRACSSRCATCSTSAAATSCTSCASPRFLLGSECVDSCPAQVSFGNTTAHACQPCRTCPTGFYASENCGATTDTICTAWGSCPPGLSFEIAPPSSTEDVTCQPCRTNCPAGQEITGDCSNGHDFACTDCEPGSARLGPDPVCTPCPTSCGPDQYLAGQCTAVTAPSCIDCPTACGSEQYLAGACTAASPRVCATCQACSSSQYETTPCTNATNRACDTCTSSCAAGQYLAGQCEGSNNPVCLACLTGCPAHEYLTGVCGGSTFRSFPTCQTCHSSCGNCTGPNGDQCTSCPGSLVLSASGACVTECEPGYFPEDVNGVPSCTSCHGACANCSGVAITDCTACAANQFLQPDGSCGPTCPLGYFADATQGACVLCATCPFGQYRTGGCVGGQDTTCVDWRQCVVGSEYETQSPSSEQNRICATCTSTCPAGEELVGTCAGSTDASCQACSSTSYKAAAGAGPCQTCTDQCTGGYFLTGQCTATTTPVCQPCVDACQSNQYLNDTCGGRVNSQCVNCQTCGSGFYQTRDCTLAHDRECARCTESCGAGFHLVGECGGSAGTANPQCVPCDGPADCGVDEFLAGQCTNTSSSDCTACTTCSSTQYQTQACSVDSNRACQDCIGTCPANFYLVGTCPGPVETLFPHTVVSAASSVTYAVLDGTAPDASAAGCQSGSIALPAGWELAPDTQATWDVIAAHPWGTQCLAIGQGQVYATNTGAATQQPCTASCSTTSCSTVDTNTGIAATGCPVRVLIARAPPSCQPCPTECAPGFHLVGECSGTQTTQCVPCATCDPGSFETAACAGTSPRADRNCTLCKTECDAGFFLTGQCSGTQDFGCSPCISASSCGTNEFLQGDCTGDQTGECTQCQNCTGNTYEVGVCGGADGQTDRSCAPCTEEADCGAGEYLTGLCTATSTPVCLTCPIASSCAQNEYLAGTCGGRQSTFCDACDPTCNSCNGPNPNQCTSCVASLSLHQGECVSSCPPTTFANTVTGHCEPCDALCASCNGNTTSNCLSCHPQSPQPFLDASAGTCVAACPPNSYGDVTLHRCVACQVCSSGFFADGGCSGTNNTVCSAWRECEAGFTQDTPPSATEDRTCKRCDPPQFYQDEAGSLECKLVRSCNSTTQYQTAAPSFTSNRECAAATVCTPGQQYETLPLSAEHDRECANATVCGSLRYETRALNATADRQCTPYTVCNSTQYQSDPGSATQDRQCTDLTVCTAGQYVSVFADATHDRQCSNCPAGFVDADTNATTPCVACNFGTYVPAVSAGACTNYECAAGTVDADRNTSSACTACPTGQYQPAQGRTSCLAASTCPAGEGLVTASTATTNTECAPCVPGTSFKGAAGNVACAPTHPCSIPAEYIVANATATHDFNCAPVTGCAANQYLQAPATLYTNNDCRNYSLCVQGVSFENVSATNSSDRVCDLCSVCSGNTYRSAVCTLTSNTVCSPITQCNFSTQWQQADATPVSDRDCQPLRVCVPGQEYQSTAPTQFSNRVCSSFTQCTSNQFTQFAGNATANRVCQAYTQCLSNEFESVAPTPTSNRQCETYTPPCSGQWESVAPTNTSDRTCSNYHPCNSTQYVVVQPTYTSDFVCAEQPLLGLTPTVSFAFGGRALGQGTSSQALGPQAAARHAWYVPPADSSASQVTGLGLARLGAAASAVAAIAVQPEPLSTLQCALLSASTAFPGDSVYVAVQLHDAALEVVGGATVELVLNGAASPAATATCQTSATTGGCSAALAIPAAWFASVGQVTVAASVAGLTGTVTCGNDPVVLGTTPAVPAVLNNEVWAVLPTQSLLPGDAFSVPVYGKLSVAIGGFVFIVAGGSGLELTQVTSPGSQWIFSTLQNSASQSSIFAQLANPSAVSFGPTTNAELLCTVSFVVQPATASGPQAISTTVSFLSNVFGSPVQPGGRTLPTLATSFDRDGQHTGAAGSVHVLAATPAALFAHAPVAEVLNLAPLTGQSESFPLAVSRVSSTGVWSLAGPSDVSCSTTDTSVLSVSANCAQVTLTPSHTAGAAAAVVSIAGNGLFTTQRLRVWYPDTPTLSAADSSLGLVTLPVPAGAGGSPTPGCTSDSVFQTTAVFATTTFRAGAALTLADVDVLPVVAPYLQPSSTLGGVVQLHTEPSPTNAGIAALGVVAHPQAAGVALIELLPSGATTPLAQLTLTASTTDVLVLARLDVVVLAGFTASWGTPTTELVAQQPATLTSSYSNVLSTYLETAGLAVSAVLSNGQRMTLSPEDFDLSLVSTNPTVASVQSSMATALASGTFGVTATLSACNVPAFEGQGTAVVSLPQVTGLRVVSLPQLTLPGNAALRFAGVATEAVLQVFVQFADNSEVDVSADPRLEVTDSGAGTVVTLSQTAQGATVVTAASSGAATLALSLPVLGVQTTVPVQVVVASSLQLSVSSYPTMPAVTIHALRAIGSTYLQGRVTATLTLSTGATLSLSSLSTLAALEVQQVSTTAAVTGALAVDLVTGVVTAGASPLVDVPTQLVATLDGLASAPYELTVVSSAVHVAALALTGAPSTLSAIAGDVAVTVGISLTLSDDSTYAGPPAAVAHLVTLSATPGSPFAISSSGAVTVSGNSAAASNLIATAPGASNTPIQTTVAVVANLLPSLGNVDLGSQAGLPVDPVQPGAQFTLPVRVNVGASNTLGEVSVTLYYIATSLQLVSVQSLLPGAGTFLSSGSLSNNIGTVGLRYVAAAGSQLSGTLDVANVVFQVLPGAVDSGMAAVVNTITRSSGTPIIATPSFSLAASINVDIVGSTRRRRRSTSFVAEGLQLPCTSAPCATCPNGPHPLGDTNGDCIFDVRDILFAQKSVLQIENDPSFAFTLSSVQLDALEADGSGAVDPQDAMYLSSVLLGYIRFVTSLTYTGVGAGSGCELALQATVTSSQPNAVLDPSNTFVIFWLQSADPAFASQAELSTLTQGTTLLNTGTAAGVFWAAEPVSTGSNVWGVRAVSDIAASTTPFGVVVLQGSLNPAGSGAVEPFRTSVVLGPSSGQLAGPASVDVQPPGATQSVSLTDVAFAPVSSLLPTMDSLACHEQVTCGPTEYASTPATRTSDPSCSSCTTCGATELVTAACSATQDTQCQNCTVCDSNHFQTAPCDPFTNTNTACAACDSCGPNQYIAQPCANGQNVQCADYTVCNPDPNVQYESVPPTPTSDRVCNNTRPACTSPTPLQHAAPTATSNRICKAFFSPCLFALCGAHGTCVGDIFTFTYVCQCDAGFTGANCDLADHCAINPCKNNGTCSSTSTGAICSCPASFTCVCCDKLAPNDCAGDPSVCSASSPGSSTGSGSSSSSSQAGMYAGVALGAVVGVVLITLLVVVAWRKRMLLRFGSNAKAKSNEFLLNDAVENPTYGDGMLAAVPRDPTYTNFQRAMLFDFLRFGAKLATTTEERLRSIYQVLPLPLPARQQLRTCAPRFSAQLQSRVADAGGVERASEDMATLMTDAFADLLLECAIDWHVQAQQSGKLDAADQDDLYAAFYETIYESTNLPGYEMVDEKVGEGASNPMYLTNDDGTYDINTMNPEYEDTQGHAYAETNPLDEDGYAVGTGGGQDATYAFAAGRDYEETPEPLYAAGGAGDEDGGPIYALGTGRGDQEYIRVDKEPEETYDLATSFGGRTHDYEEAQIAEESPYVLATGAKPSEADENLYAALTEIDDDEDTEPTYDMGTGDVLVQRADPKLQDIYVLAKDTGDKTSTLRRQGDSVKRRVAGRRHSIQADPSEQQLFVKAPEPDSNA